LREGPNARENSPRTGEGKCGFTRFLYAVRNLSRILKGDPPGEHWKDHTKF